MSPEASFDKHWHSDSYTNGSLQGVNEKQVRPGFQIKTWELCLRTKPGKRSCITWVRGERLPGNEWSELWKAFATPQLKLSHQGAKVPLLHLFMIKSPICRSNERPLKKPGDQRWRGKEKVLQWKQGMWKGKGDLILLKVYFLEDAKQLEKYFRVLNNKTNAEDSHELNESKSKEQTFLKPAPSSGTIYLFLLFSTICVTSPRSWRHVYLQ